MKKINFFWSQSSTPHLPSLRSVSNWGRRSHYCCTESFQCRLYFGIMNLSVLVIESSVASTNQIAKGMLLASIRFVEFTPTNQIRYSLRADSARRALLCSWKYSGRDLPGELGPHFQCLNPRHVLCTQSYYHHLSIDFGHYRLFPDAVSRFRTHPPVFAY